MLYLLTYYSVDNTKQKSKEYKTEVPIQRVDDCRETKEHEYHSLGNVRQHLHEIFDRCRCCLRDVVFYVMT